MNTRRLALLLSILLLVAVSALPAGIDLVVMVDTSASMFPVFDDLVNYLLRDILENRLREGDSFHLLSFAGSTEKELSESIEATSDLAAIIARILLLKPLGSHTDLIGALETLYEYVRALPEDNSKLVLILTDGIHDPPPGSPNRVGSEEALARLLANTERIRREGWEVRILRTGEDATLREGEEATLREGEDAWLPSQGQEATLREGQEATLPSQGEEAPAAAEDREVEAAAQAPGGEPGAQDLLEELAEGLSTEVVEMEEPASSASGMLSGRLTGFATLSFPGDLGAVSRRVQVPFAVTSFSDQPLDLTLAAVTYGERNLLAAPARVRVSPQASGQLDASLRLPPGLSPGPQRLPVVLSFSDPEVRISPLRGELLFTYLPSAARGSWLRGFLSAYWLYVVIAAVVAALVVFLVLFLRNRMADASFAGFYAPSGRGRKRGRPIIMRVREQNSQIGSRNIHRVPAKSSLSVGGDGSAFLIYFVPMPRRIGVLKNDGKGFVFVPIRTEFFVDLTGPLPDCLGKEIRALSLRGYPVAFSFHEYVSPLEEINRLMRSIHHEGSYPLKGKSKQP